MTARAPTCWPQFVAGGNDREATDKTMHLAEELARLGRPATQGVVPRPQPDMRLTPPL